MRLGAAVSPTVFIIQLISPVSLSGWDAPFLPPANAVLYSPDTKVPRTGELALRNAIPTNINMKSIQVLQLSSMQKHQRYSPSMLMGRAVVEFVVKKGDGSMFTPQSGGVPRKTATIQVVLDGYSASLTTGNFANTCKNHNIHEYSHWKYRATKQEETCYQGDC
ncbi:putative peptidylprolyl isomerase [Helianthus debilis subsp. tardiflorus]